MLNACWRALHKGHGGLMFNPPPAHENPDSPLVLGRHDTVDVPQPVARTAFADRHIGAVLARLMDLGLADAMQRKRRKGAPLRAACPCQRRTRLVSTRPAPSVCDQTLPQSSEALCSPMQRTSCVRLASLRRAMMPAQMASTL